MTEDFSWPPPVCPPCRKGWHDLCAWVTGCECESGACLPLPDDEEST